MHNQRGAWLSLRNKRVLTVRIIINKRDRSRDIMATFVHSSRHSGERSLDSWQPKEDERYAVARCTALFQETNMPAAGAGCFERETLVRRCERMNAFDQQSAGGKCDAIRMKGR